MVQILQSRRFRVIAASAITVLFLFAAYLQYSSIPRFSIPPLAPSSAPSSVSSAPLSVSSAPSSVSSAPSSASSVPSSASSLPSPTCAPAVDWSRFAYAQYVTNTAYLCNSVMLFESLHRLGSKADRLMMYPADFDLDVNPDSTEKRLLALAQDLYGVKLVPITVQRRESSDTTWAESFTKLLAFNQTQYHRILSLDSDSTILQTMDELFHAPSSPVAMPRAYWLNPDDHTLSSQMVLIEPSKMEFDRILAAINSAGSNDYDMEIVNHLYGNSCMILPHRPYDLLTGEFKRKDHSQYLGNDVEVWNPEVVLAEGKFLHFSDWPIPKPWLVTPGQVDMAKPACDADPSTGEETDCRAQKIWVNFYMDFAKRRKEICSIDLPGHTRRSGAERRNIDALTSHEIYWPEVFVRQ
ncbi:MAG: N-acetylglucosaminyltransferase [Trizodia sp. TS-e1964]|nr:MAG: N-acetylglucosaminyltransferase [Trizodia sp. TS-e1964]